jgi:hypothetical protein
MNKRIACIGSRTLTGYQLNICEKIGTWLALQGYTISTGNAEGADQAFAAGANRVDPTRVHLCLPWLSYEAEKIVTGNNIAYPPYPDWMWKEAQKHHPVWNRLSKGAKLLQVRNICIVHGVAQVVAWPSSKIGGGGTGQGMRYARAISIPVIDLSKEEDLERVATKMVIR